MWKPIAHYGIKREHAPESHQWARLGVLLYNAEDHKCSVITDIIAHGTFYAKPLDSVLNPPYISGDIMVFKGEYEDDGTIKKRYDKVGHIHTDQDSTGNTSYQVELFGTSVSSLVSEGSREGDNKGIWQNVFLEDANMYQPPSHPAEDENQDPPVQAPKWNAEKKPDVPKWNANPAPAEAEQPPDNDEYVEDDLPF